MEISYIQTNLNFWQFGSPPILLVKMIIQKKSQKRLTKKWIYERVMITLKYQSLMKLDSMSWKLKCQDCINRHVGHLRPSWAGHGDISEVSLHSSLSLEPVILRRSQKSGDILVVSGSWARGQLPPGYSCWEELREKPEAVQLTLELLKCDIRVIMRAV